MGRKGVLSSAAAGGSLIAASIVLVIGVSAVIGFRGFDTVRAVSGEQAVSLDRRAAEREAGANARPATAVIGAARRPAKRRAARRKPVHRAAAKAPARSSGLSAPAKPRTRTPAAAPETSPAVEQPPPAVEAPTVAPVVPPTPVDEVVEDVAGTAENVGDVLLDLRDALP